MTPAETAAHVWLQTQGYAPDTIVFNYTRSPDFCTSDGKGWEVKRLVGRVARFELRQIATLRQKNTPTAVLFWRDGENAPVTVTDFADLPMPGQWGDVLLRVTWQPRAAPSQQIHSPAEVDALVAFCLTEGRGK